MTQEQQTQLAQLEETIRQAQQQIEELKNPKPKKFEWEYPVNNIYMIGNYTCRYGCNGNDQNYIEHGRYRKTKKAAEQSLLRNKRANRLEALAEQLGGLCEWKLFATNNTIVQDNRNKWVVSNPSFFNPSVVYMTGECATEICRMLNSGEFSLDGEL